jgi:quaternary ammonium compound-resistance protein sugE
MNWGLLFVAGVLEIVWAIGMKSSHGFTRIWPSLTVIVCMSASFTLLALAMRSIPLGTAYAVWTGIGAVGTVIYGMIFLGESSSVSRILCLILILTGIVGLKLLGHK